MTTAAAWLALAEKARMANGPDREIDGALSLALGFPQAWFGDEWGSSYIDGPYCMLDAATWSGKGLTFEAKHYTDYLSAIIALIEKEFPGCDWQLNKGGSGIILLPVAGWDDPMQIGFEGKTVALALVAAFCHAKAAQAQEQENGR